MHTTLFRHISLTFALNCPFMLDWDGKIARREQKKKSVIERDFTKPWWCSANGINADSSETARQPITSRLNACVECGLLRYDFFESVYPSLSCIFPNPAAGGLEENGTSTMEEKEQVYSDYWLYLSLDTVYSTCPAVGTFGSIRACVWYFTYTKLLLQ